MLPVKNRITKQLLPVILKQNKAFRAEYLTLRLHLRHEGEVGYGQPAKLAVIIANKTLSCSVDRHLIKRRIHAILGPSWPQINNNLDLIIQINKSPIDLSFNNLKNEILSILKEANITVKK